MTPSPRRAVRRAFSLVEMLIAIAISGALLSATLVALDTTFKGYEVNADSASSHVVTRIAVNRIMGLVRTGTDFGPMPSDVLDNAQNPMVADYFEFVSERDEFGNPVTLTRIEYRYADQGALYRSWGVAQTPPPLGFEPSGPGELHLVQIDADTDAETSFLLLERVRAVRFVLSYDVGPRLERCTMDVTVEPLVPDDLKLTTDAPPQTVRLVASAMPRRIVE